MDFTKYLVHKYNLLIYSSSVNSGCYSEFVAEPYTIYMDHRTFTVTIKTKEDKWFGSSEDNDYNPRFITFEDYFRNWRCPTPEEKCMFEMLYGVELFWSEDNPFVWPSEEDLK